MKQEWFSAIGQWAASVAHELRNPLGAAKNTVHTIQEIAVTKQIDVRRRSAGWISPMARDPRYRPRHHAEQHDGAIAVTSEPSEGTCVTIALPLAVAKGDTAKNANGAEVIRAVA
jgi:signal transduction histidine kinase